MTVSFTPILSARIRRFEFMQLNEVALAALPKIFPNVEFSLRRLQSLIIHLQIDVDLLSANFEELKLIIGSYLHYRASIVPYADLEQGKRESAELYLIATQELVAEENLKFLFSFDRHAVWNELAKYDIFGNERLDRIFSLNYPLANTVCYLSDSSRDSVELLDKGISELKRRLLNLTKWDSRINWFKTDGGLDQAKIDVANNYFSKSKNYYFPFLDLADVRKFFQTYGSESDRELIFRKIRSNYHNKNTRDNNKKKPCSFSIDKKTEKMIEEIAEKFGVARATVLDAIFNSANKKSLLGLYEKGVANKRKSPALIGVGEYSFPMGGAVSTSAAALYRVTMVEGFKKNMQTTDMPQLKLKD